MHKWGWLKVTLMSRRNGPGPKRLECQLNQTWLSPAKKAREAGQQTAPAWGTEGL
jgi:hypothetical protein